MCIAFAARLVAMCRFESQYTLPTRALRRLRARSGRRRRLLLLASCSAPCLARLPSRNMPAVDTSAASRALTSATKAPAAKTSAGPASTARVSDADDDDATPDAVVAHTVTQAAPAREADNVSTSYLVLAPSTTAVVTRSQVSLAAAFAGSPSSGFILLPSSALAAPVAPTSTIALPTAAAADDGATASSTANAHTGASALA